MKLCLFLFLFPFQLFATIYNSDGSQADVQSLVSSAIDGDTVTIPSGSFSWSSGVTVSGKGIKIIGVSGGEVVGYTSTSTTIGTGSKTFTTQSGLNFVTSETIRVWLNGGVRDSNGNGTGVKPWMEGTVTSYSGTSLTLNITSTSGDSGTKSLWILTRNASSTITHNAGSSALFTVTDDNTASVEVSGLRLMRGTGTGNYFELNSGGSNYVPALIHDIWFDCEGSTVAILATVNRGVIYDCDFVCLNAGSTNTEGLKVSVSLSTWSSTSTMGTVDSGGSSNIYMEDCTFNALLTSHDIDDNGRAVVRYCVFNQSSAGGTHGPDTSNYGVRHLEWYNNTCVFNEIGGSPDLETMNIARWLLLRGGTGVVTDNVMPDIASTAWSNKPEIELAIYNLERNAGPNPCWGAGVSGIQYHCPRQIGFGNVTGSGTDGLGRSVDSVGYVGDSEPLYLWNNTGSPTISVTSGGFGECTGSDSASDYIQSSRDYYTSSKPSYTKYEYPHPLRTSSQPSAVMNVESLIIN